MSTGGEILPKHKQEEEATKNEGDYKDEKVMGAAGFFQHFGSTQNQGN